MTDSDIEKIESVRSQRIISRPLEILLRIFGIWPDASGRLYVKVFWFLMITTITTSQYLFLVTHARYMNHTAFMYAVSTTMAFTIKFIKIFTFWFNQRKFDNIWRTVSTSWKRAGDDGLGATAEGDRAHLSHYVPNAIVAFNFSSVLMTTYSIVISGIRYDEASNATRPYILHFELPFDINRRSVYPYLLFAQFLYLTLVTCVAATFSSVLIILMLYLNDQIDDVCECLTSLSTKEEERGTGTIVEIIKKHQRIITFLGNIESLYTYIALALIIINTIITCTLGFILVTTVGTPNFSKAITKTLLFYCVVNMDIFVFCFAGEYISAKSREIGKAAYSSPWYRSNCHSRIILFLIMRSQDQLSITMGKFMDLTLERFASITRVSASYVSVLLAMY